MDIGNMELMHERSPEHLRMEQQGIKYDKGREHKKSIQFPPGCS